jgi:hypothetical protein
MANIARKYGEMYMASVTSTCLGVYKATTTNRYGGIKIPSVMAGKEAYIWSIILTGLEVFI